MKINNLKINSFGGLENKNIEFNKFNLICGENESGKSTLLNYIMSIFYGISKNKNGKNISDFDRFYPWNSSDFSGQINYDLDDGSNYRVYRNFENKDIYIYDKNNTEISNLFLVDKKLGSQFLKDQINLDREVLEKTFIINQNSLKIPKNDRDELIQKISNLIESGSEEISYKKLLKKLSIMQLENVGSDRSSDRPYNIIKENYEKISEEISYLKNVNDDKYLINKKNNDIDNTKEKKNVKIIKKIDWKKVQDSKDKIGALGEEIVFDILTQKAEEHNLKMPVHVSKEEGDGAGYDIRAWDKDDKELHIEVKASKEKYSDGFEITRNEIEASKNKDYPYIIYRVYNLDIKNKNCSIEIYSGPVTDETFKLESTKFIVYKK